MKKFLLGCCVACAAVLLASCGSTKVEAEAEAKVEAPNFEGAWVVEEFVKDGAAVTGSTAHFEIVAPKDGVYDIRGNNGLNQFGGNFTIAENKIAPVDPAGCFSTKMSGTAEVMAYENAFMDVMLAENDIAIVDGKLVISNETAKITFTEGEPAAAVIEE